MPTHGPKCAKCGATIGLSLEPLTNKYGHVDAAAVFCRCGHTWNTRSRYALRRVMKEKGIAR